jgi:hypothetical protein
MKTTNLSTKVSAKPSITASFKRTTRTTEQKERLRLAKKKIRTLKKDLYEIYHLLRDQATDSKAEQLRACIITNCNIIIQSYRDIRNNVVFQLPA